MFQSPQQHPESGALRHDQAKRRIEEDELERKTFAAKMARAIATSPARDEALVVALYGEWGSGKTTIKHFLRHYLTKDHRIEPVEFSPWEWTGRDTLLDAFFLQVERAVRRSWKWTDIRFSWRFRRYGAALGIFAPFAAWGQAWWIPLLMFLGGGTVVYWPGFGDSRPETHLIAVVIAVLGAALTLFQVASEGISTFAAKWAELRRSSLPEIRAELVALLAKQKRPTVVFLDDLDRLTDDEICQVVAFTKAIANLPGIVFVVLCQRDKVARALGDEDFLHKIVQAGFHVPVPPSGALRQMLEKGLREIVSDVRFARRWDWQRWNTFHAEHLCNYFRTPRHVARYLGSLPFYLHQHLNEQSLEINAVDAAVLEVLRMYEPAIFERLAGRPIITERNVLIWLSSDYEKSKQEAVIADIVSLVPETDRERLKAFLKALFPLLDPASPGSDTTLDAWDREMRVCHPHHYDRYFQLILPSGQCSAADFDRVRAAAAVSPDELYHALRELDGRRLLGDFMSRASVVFAEADPKRAENFLLALCTIGDELPEQLGYGETNQARTHAVAVCADLLRHTDADTRVRWLKTALAGSGLDVPCILVRYLSYKMEGKPLDLPVSPEAQAELTELAVDKIRDAAKNEKLWHSAFMAKHFDLWARAKGDAEVKIWATQSAKNNRRAVTLALAYASVGFVNTEEYPRFHAADLEKYADVTVLAGLTEGPNGHSLPNRKREAEAVLMLRDARNRKKDGKPYAVVHLRENDPTEHR